MRQSRKGKPNPLLQIFPRRKALPVGSQCYYVSNFHAKDNLGAKARLKIKFPQFYLIESLLVFNFWTILFKLESIEFLDIRQIFKYT